MSTKKTTATQEATKPVVLKDGQIRVTKIGANFAASVVGTEERYAKKVSKEEATVLLEKITAYNKRPSKGKKEEIVNLLEPTKAKLKKEREVEVSKAKGLKQQSKKAEKGIEGGTVGAQKSLLEQLEAEISGDETGEKVSKVQAILDKFKKVETKAPIPAPAVTPYPTRREY